MTILEALKQLRDDLKLWCTNNLNKKLNKNLTADEGGKFLVTDEYGEITTTDIAAAVDELNYISGVRSNIQEQLDNKSDSNHSHTITVNAMGDDVLTFVGTGGTNEVTCSVSHATSGIDAGSYRSVTVDEYGHITAGENPTTLAGYGITDAELKGASENAYNSACSYVDGKIDEVNGSINGINETVGQHTSDISALEEDVLALQSKFGDGEGTVESMIADAQAATISTIETDMAQLEEALLEGLDNIIATQNSILGG